MEIVCKRHTELPHTSRLFSDLIYHFDRVASLYPYNPFDARSYGDAARAIDFPDERRARLAAALAAQNPASDSLAKLARPGTVAVVTGQQVGLFSGPAYTIYKALTAAKLASQLTASGIEAVPVFWLATEDHDLAEVSSCWTFNSAREPVGLKVEAGATGERPVGGIAIAEPPLEALRAALGTLPFGDEIFERVRAAYAPGASFGGAFTALLRDLLAGYGLVFFDPMHPESRRLAAPLMAKAVEAAPDLSAQILERNAQLTGLGYHAQVHFEDHTSLFFLLEGGHRKALRRRNGEYLTGEGKYTAAELAGRGESLSPNAILRPVVQDYMLPTVAYIGGPAELAYLAQSQVVYRTLLGRMPVAAPRTGFTLIDARARKLMDRYGLTLESFYGGPEGLDEHIAARLAPPEVTAAIEDARATTGASLDQLRATVAGFDATLAEALDRSGRKIRYQLEKIQGKIARESMKRSQRGREESAYLNGLLYPHKHLQERFYSILPFLATHGMELIEGLYEQVRLDCPDHHIAYL